MVLKTLKVLKLYCNYNYCVRSIARRIEIPLEKNRSLSA